jgi:hypothetical protein
MPAAARRSAAPGRSSATIAEPRGGKPSFASSKSASPTHCRWTAARSSVASQGSAAAAPPAQTTPATDPVGERRQRGRACESFRAAPARTPSQFRWPYQCMPKNREKSETKKPNIAVRLWLNESVAPATTLAKIGFTTSPGDRLEVLFGGSRRAQSWLKGLNIRGRNPRQTRNPPRATQRPNGLARIQADRRCSRLESPHTRTKLRHRRVQFRHRRNSRSTLLKKESGPGR